MTCLNANINPNNYILPDAEGDGDQEGIVPDERRRRRRRRSAVKGRKLSKRQVGNVDDEGAVTTNRTIVSEVTIIILAI